MTYHPFSIIGLERKSRWLVTCDHAANTVPPDLGGTLGLPEADMARHIAYDVGAAGVAQALAERGIMAGGGTFYAGRALGAMGVEDSKGVLRLSFTHYTTKDEIDKLLNALDDLF